MNIPLVRVRVKEICAVRAPDRIDGFCSGDRAKFQGASH